MRDTTGIKRLVQKARRRLQLQSAFEAATLAVIPASAAALVSIYMLRRGLVEGGTGWALLAASVGIVGVAFVAGMFRRFSDVEVATRIDRASGLSDRMANACSFESLLAGDADHDDETSAFMIASIEDAIAHIGKADPVAATPFTRPRESKPAMAFVAVSAILASLYFTAEPARVVTNDDPLDPAEVERQKNIAELDDEDLDYTRELANDLRRTAKDTDDAHLEKLVNEIDKLLDEAERGELTKEELLERLADAQDNYMEGSEDDVDESMKDLKESGKELKKSELSKQIGKALEQGDLEKAGQEMDKLADKLENEDVPQKKREKLAKAFDKAADKMEQRDKKREDKINKDIKRKQEQRKRLEKKLKEAKNERQKQDAKKRLNKNKRDLKKLSRKKQQMQKSQHKRRMKQLSRNMKQTAKQLRNKQQNQKSRKQVAKSMRNMRNQARRISQDQRRVANQKKMATQMDDLKEAMRRAKRRGSRGPADKFGRNRRSKDFQRRARGGKGQRTAWKPGNRGKNGGKLGGQGKRPGQGQGNKPGGQGQKPGGNSYGDGHDPNLAGDPTRKAGKTKDESLQGTHGKGPSTRETILTAAQKGFSAQGYKKVFAQYKKQIEEVIHSEKVPAGYKYYVKRYFQNIKPRGSK